MTKVYKTVTKKIETKEFVSRHCDWCGIEMEEGYGDTGGSNRKFLLLFSKGKDYGWDGGGYEKGWEVSDLCDNCVDKLKELLITSGLKITPTESDW